MFKPIPSNKATVSEYQAKKAWRLDETTPELTFHAGANLEGPFIEDRSPENESGTKVEAVYKLMRHMYYREEGTIYDKFGVLDPENIDLSTFPTKPRAIVYVLKISSKLFGRKIEPGSLEISTVQKDEQITAVDDGNGNLVLKGTDTVLGNVFYQTGTLVLTKRPNSIFRLPDFTVFPNYNFEEIIFEDFGEATGYPSYNFDAFDLLFRDFELQFESFVKNYENEIVADIEPNEFGATTNDSARTSNTEPIDALKGGDFRPYVTNTGLYNDDYELLATGKLSRPIKLSESTPMSILVRFDT